MLLLTRRMNEEIVIGDGIVIKVIEIRRDTVRLGITAPSDVPVNRKEVYLSKLKEKQRAETEQEGTGEPGDHQFGRGVEYKRGIPLNGFPITYDPDGSDADSSM